MNTVALVVNWNRQNIAEQFNISRMAGLQNFSGLHNISINDKVPVIRGMGYDLAIQLMTWDCNANKLLTTKQSRCLLLIESFRLGSDEYHSINGFFVVSGTFRKMQVKPGAYRYFVCMHTQPPFRYLNSRCRYMPAIISYAKGVKYLKIALTLAETIQIENFRNELFEAVQYDEFADTTTNADTSNNEKKDEDDDIGMLDINENNAAKDVAKTQKKNIAENDIAESKSDDDNIESDSNDNADSTKVETA